MGFGLAGAMAGAGGAALKSLQAREESYLQEQRAKRLAELQNEQAIERINIQDLIDGKKIDKNLTEYTDTGVKFYNDKGAMIGERSYNPAELAARKASQEGTQLDIEAKKADIAYKKANAAREVQGISLDRVRAANYGSGGGRRRGGGSGDDGDSKAPTGNTPEDIAAKVVYENVKAADAARKAGVPEHVIQTAALALIGNMKAMADSGNKPVRSVSYGFNRTMDDLIKKANAGNTTWANRPLDSRGN